jgi:hypothetical protein
MRKLEKLRVRFYFFYLIDVVVVKIKLFNLENTREKKGYH